MSFEAITSIAQAETDAKAAVAAAEAKAKQPAPRRRRSWRNSTARQRRKPRATLRRWQGSWRIRRLFCVPELKPDWIRQQVS